MLALLVAAPALPAHAGTAQRFYRSLEAGDVAKAEQAARRMTAAEINSPHEDECYTTPLLAALRARQEGLMRVLVELGAEVDLTTCDGRTALHAAAIQQWEPGLRFLLEHGADLEARDRQGLTPLHVSTSMDSNMKMLQEMLMHDATSDAFGAEVRSRFLLEPLLRTSRLLLEAGADIDARNAAGETPLLYAVENRRPLHAVYLALVGADLEAATPGGRTPLMAAVESPRPGLAQVLLMLGAQAETGAGDARPLARACARFERTPEGLLADVIADLLAHGARDEDGRVYDVAAGLLNRSTGLTRETAFSLMRASLESGLDPNLGEPDYGTPPFFHACHEAGKKDRDHRAWLDLVRGMLARGAAVNAPYAGHDGHWDEGETVLVHAIWDFCWDLVELLVEHGAVLTPAQWTGIEEGWRQMNDEPPPEALPLLEAARAAGT